MTINMRYGDADAEAITAIANSNADVLMIHELTPKAVGRLRAAGLERTFPYHVAEPRLDAAGTAVYSRSVMISRTRIDGLRRAALSARIRIGGVTPDPTVVSVHPASPWPHPVDGWKHDLDALPSILTELSNEARSGAIIVGGDFNSTIDMRPFRRLLEVGYDDASEQAGEGRQFTFPNSPMVPPFMGIDHILTRNATAVSTETVPVLASDHRALLATVLIPRR